jgi:hypothetical protein
MQADLTGDQAAHVAPVQVCVVPSQQEQFAHASRVYVPNMGTSPGCTETNVQLANPMLGLASTVTISSRD